jgi:hypothetical protein
MDCDGGHRTKFEFKQLELDGVDVFSHIM